MPGPIADVTILDLTEHIAGPYATKLLADYGANVIKLERPGGGDPSRALGPYPGDEPHPERSGTFFYLNTNKRSIVIDLQAEAGREAFGRLVERADAVVESFRPGVLDRLGAGWEAIHARKPSAPLISITNFGQYGPYRDYRASDLVLYAFAGEMASMGVSEREPVKMYGTAALVQSGAAAATAIFGALMVGCEQGIGQHVDFSLAESHLGSADRRHAAAIAFEFSGRKNARPSREARGILRGIYPCADGFVELTGAGGRLDRFARMLGDPEWLDDPKWRRPGALTDPALGEEFEANFYPWLFTHTRSEIWAAAREARVLCAPLLSIDEIRAEPHFRERGFWTEVEHAELGAVEIPGRPLIMPDSPWELRRPAPLLGEHTREDPRRGRIRVRRDRRARCERGGGGTSVSGRLPLEGVRVLDFCVVWAGTFGTMLLADLGAEVIKVENPFVMQPMTRGNKAHPSKQELAMAAPLAGGYPNNEPGPRPWNYHPTFVQLYRNKKSVTIDLRRPEGLDVLARLIPQCDVVVENNATETLEKLGITYDWLRELREDIIMLRLPAYGSTGQYAQARALGVHLESVAGHTLLRGYRDADPTENTPIFSGDYFAGSQVALGVMMALWHRKRTGRGQKMEMSQAENASAMMFQAFLDHAMNERVHERAGNRSVYAEAPYGVYPCRGGDSAQAEDRWIAITVTSDEEWRALRTAMGDPAWAAAPELETAAGRAAHQDLLDAGLADWTRDQDDEALFHQLQGAGVPASPVMYAHRVLDDPQVAARGIYQPQELYDGVGTYRFLTPFFRLPETPVTVRRGPVAMGQDNEYVYKDLAGVSDEEYEALRAAGHVAMDFDESVP